MPVVAILKKWLLHEGFNKHKDLDWQAGHITWPLHERGHYNYMGGGLIVMELFSFLKIALSEIHFLGCARFH